MGEQRLRLVVGAGALPASCLMPGRRGTARESSCQRGWLQQSRQLCGWGSKRLQLQVVVEVAEPQVPVQRQKHLQQLPLPCCGHRFGSHQRRAEPQQQGLQRLPPQ